MGKKCKNSKAIHNLAKYPQNVSLTALTNLATD